MFISQAYHIGTVKSIPLPLPLPLPWQQPVPGADRGHGAEEEPEEEHLDGQHADVFGKALGQVVVVPLAELDGAPQRPQPH